MKTSKYTDTQILSILKQNEHGVSVPELCREHGMSDATFYNGVQSSVAWMPRLWNAWKSLRTRTVV